MELSTIVMLWSVTVAFVQVAPFFRSAPFLLFVLARTLWSLANVALMLRLPKVAAPAGARQGVIALTPEPLPQ